MSTDKIQLKPLGEDSESRRFYVMDNERRPGTPLGMVTLTPEQTEFFREAMVNPPVPQPVPTTFETYMRERVLDNPSKYQRNNVLLSSMTLPERWAAAAAMWRESLPQGYVYP